MSDQCSFCGQSAEGNHSIHRDGRDEGPLVPLCNECGSVSSGLMEEEIWSRTSTLVWVEKAVVAQILERHEGATLVNDRTPAWQFGVATAYAHSTIIVEALGLQFAELFDTVAADGELQKAVTAAVRLGSQGFEILTMITDWRELNVTTNAGSS